MPCLRWNINDYYPYLWKLPITFCGDLHYGFSVHHALVLALFLLFVQDCGMRYSFALIHLIFHVKSVQISQYRNAVLEWSFPNQQQRHSRDIPRVRSCTTNCFARVVMISAIAIVSMSCFCAWPVHDIFVRSTNTKNKFDKGISLKNFASFHTYWNVAYR